MPSTKPTLARPEARRASIADEEAIDLTDLMDSDDDEHVPPTLSDLPPLLDTSALSEVEPLEPDMLPASALEVLEPDAEPEILSGSALRAIDADDHPQEQAREPEMKVELIEGFEGTLVDPSSERRARARRPERKAESAAPPAVIVHVCPSCEAPQPEPTPVFCEACGTKLKSKSAARKAEIEADVASIRCGDCGIRNPPAAAQCRNCGLPLRQPS